MKVAVVGAGVSGLAATWLLNEYSDHEVHLFEAEDRPGGHANTVDFVKPGVNGAKPVKVDRGFIVFNLPTYPNFSRFLHRSGIKWTETEMTFSVSRDQGAFEWAGKNPLTVFCQTANLFKPSMYRMVWDIFRFNAQTTAALQRGEVEFDGLSLGQFLQREGYSQAFVDDYILPMTACIWSTPPNTCALDFPARHLIRFMYNHHLLQIIRKPPWLTIAGGSEQYVNRIISKLPKDQLHLNTPIQYVKTPSPDDEAHASEIVITTQEGEAMTFDHVIMACHSDTTHQLLERGGLVTEMEQKIFSGFSWAKNEVVLHNDVRLMPVREIAWSCWNFLTSTSSAGDGTVRSNSEQVSLTYDMNQLQHISEEVHGKVLVTLNPPFEPRSETIISRKAFDHPMFNDKTVWAQENIKLIQNQRGVTFAGAWTKYGFHEDGFTSGLRVVSQYLGVEPPFKMLSAERRVVYSDGGGRAFEQLEKIRRFLSVWVFAIINYLLGYFGFLSKGKKEP